MTLNIDLEEVPFAILDAVKARIMANRRRLQQGQQQPRRSTRPRPQFVKIGANSKTWRLPKQAAMVLPDDNAFAFAWVNSIRTVKSPGLWWSVISADTKTRVDDSVSDQFGYAYSAWLGLPAGGNRIIAVMLGRIRSSNDPSISGVPINRAYICSPSTVREIAIPSILANVILPLNPQYPYSDYEVQYPGGLYTSPFPPRQISRTPGADSAEGLLSIYSDYPWTPAIFELLNRVFSYANSNMFREYLPSKGHRTYYWDWANGAKAGIYFGEWKGDPENVDIDANPSLFSELGDATIRLSPQISLPPYITTPVDPQGRPALPLTAWDWDDPAYCRQMCLALGFSAADLQP